MTALPPGLGATPWTVDPDHRDIVRDAKGERIADCMIYMRDTPHLGDIYAGVRRMSRARAAMCAAAPGMFLALRTLLDLYGGSAVAHGEGGAVEHPSWASARAALKAAEADPS